MLNIDEKLKEYDIEIDRAIEKEYTALQEQEIEYCQLINKGVQLRKEILENPESVDKDSFEILNNKSFDIHLLAPKYQVLLKAHNLNNILISKYMELVNDLKAKNKFEEVIELYEHIFKFSHNYHCYVYIADIYLKIFNNPQKSLEIYKKIEPYLSNDIEFLWYISDVYLAIKDYFNQVLYLQKATKLQLKYYEENNNA